MYEAPGHIEFDLLYAEHAVPVYRFALRLSGNTDDAEDLAAEALARAFQQNTAFRGDASARSWLFSIVLNQWRMMVRKRSRAIVSLEDVEQVASTFRFRDIDLARAIQSLPQNQREAFLLVKGEGLTHAEAAQVACVPVGTMYFRVHAAVQELRRALEPTVSDLQLSKVALNDEL